MSLDWPTLEALLDKGDPDGVAEAVKDLDNAARRALTAALTAYVKDWRGTADPGWAGDWNRQWERLGHRCAALRTAGAGCLSGADAVSRWLLRQDLWQGMDTGDRVLDVLGQRDAPWLADVAGRMAQRLRTRDTSSAALVVELVRRTGVEPPATEGFLSCWAYAIGVGGRPLVDALRQDPLLPTLAPMLFQVDGMGSWFESSDWPAALAELTGAGTLPRELVIDGCLGRLLRGGRPNELRGYLHVYEALRPDEAEVRARIRDFARLLPDAHSTLAGVAQRELRRVDESAALDLETILEASRAVLFRPEKKLVTTQLAWLDKVLRRHPDRAGEILTTAAVAFDHDAADVQGRVVALVVRHHRHLDAGGRAELLDLAGDLPADMRARLAEALGGSAPESTVPPPPVGPPMAAARLPMPPPIGSAAELAEEMAVLLASIWTAPPDLVQIERILAGLVSFAHADRAALHAALHPVLARSGRWDGSGRHTTPADCFGGVLAAAMAPPAAPAPVELAATPDRRRSGNQVSGLSRVLRARFHEIAAGIAVGSAPVLLATPTEVTGHLDPAVLLARIEQAAAQGWTPWEYDLQQALLRLPRTAEPTIAARAARLGTPAGKRFADWLTTGGLPDPQVTRIPLTRSRQYEYYSGRPAFEEFVAVGPAAGTPRPDSVAGAVLSMLPDVRSAGYLDVVFGWLTCWPAILPAHRDVIAVHLVPALALGTEHGRGTGVVLPMLAEADGPVGPGLTLALAYGLGAAEQTDRSAAVDALLILAGRGQLDGSALGTEIAALVAHNALKLTRVLPGLRDVTRSGAYPQMWATIAAALPGLLPGEGAKPVPGLADLVALGVEVAERVGVRGPIPGIAACAGRTGGSRLVTEARRLHRHLTADSHRTTSTRG